LVSVLERHDKRRTVFEIHHADIDEESDFAEQLLNIKDTWLDLVLYWNGKIYLYLFYPIFFFWSIETNAVNGNLQFHSYINNPVLLFSGIKYFEHEKCNGMTPIVRLETCVMQ
jgi:hypothetical protein